MTKYKKVLLAVDFSSDNDQIIERAQKIVKDDGAELLLVHAHEPTIAAYQTGGMASFSTQVVALDDELRKMGEKNLAELAKKLKVKSANCFLPYGKASLEIKRVAEENDVDLIVLGTHGQHGLGLLLGSTANAVLHGVSCDVLAVRAKEKKD
ncbi:MAG: universal stress protein [Pseudomonadales bacterium]